MTRPAVLTVVWLAVFVLSGGHALALVMLAASTAWLLVELARSFDRPEPLAPYRYPGGDL